MFSRVVPRSHSIWRAGAGRLPGLTVMPQRHFSRTQTRLDAVRPVEDEKEEESIIQSMGGWYPLVGLSAVALLGKEFIIFNGGGLNFFFFYAFWGGVYMTQGEALSKMFNEDMEAYRKNFLYDPLDYAIEGYKQTIISLKAQTHMLDYIKDVAKHSPLSIKAEAEALNKMAALDARERAVLALSSQKSLQQLKNANVATILQENFGDDVEVAWTSGPKKNFDIFMENGLADLEKGVKTNLPFDKDPVKQVYKTQLVKYAKKLAPYKKDDVVTQASEWPVDHNLL